MNFSIQGLESSIDLHDACDGRNKTKNQSQDKHDNSRPKCSPFKPVVSVEPPLLQGLWPCVVVRFLHLTKSLLPIRVVAEVEHFVGRYGRLDRSLNVHVVLFANSTRSFRRLKVRGGEQRDRVLWVSAKKPSGYRRLTMVSRLSREKLCACPHLSFDRQYFCKADTCRKTRNRPFPTKVRWSDK